MLNRYIKKHSTCLLQAGANRGVIFDSNRNCFHLIPLSLIDFVKETECKTIEEAYRMYDESDKETVTEYLDFLMEKEVIFYCDSQEEARRFPDLNTEWLYPANISNATVDIYSTDDILAFNHFKGNYYIPFIQFNILSPVCSIEELEHMVDCMLTDYIQGIQLVFDNAQNFSDKELTEICYSKKRIEIIIAYNSRMDQSIVDFGYRIDFTRAKELTNLSCGVVSYKYFNPQLLHYTESLTHNTCLNRKIAVDAEGNIKNCPSMKESFGNIKDTTIEEALRKPGFKKYWNIKKDEITKCKDCEFRHICTDCRAYLENPEDIYSAPLKCGYDPYTCEWKEWSTNPLKNQAIQYYGMSDLMLR